MTEVLVKVLFFAKARELTCKNEDNIILKNTVSYRDLFEQIVSNYSLEPIKDNIILAVNEEYCTESDTIVTLKEGDEIAIIPPLSGG